MSDKRQGGIDNTIRNSPRIHQFTREDKEGDGHEREAVRPVKQILGNDLAVKHARRSIKATPLINKANAMGMPKAIAPISEPRKMVMVMIGFLPVDSVPDHKFPRAFLLPIPSGE